MGIGSAPTGGTDVAWARPRPPLVVSLEVASHDAGKMLGANDQQVVQALPTDRPNPAPSDGIGVGRTDGRAEHLGPSRAPHVVERPGELRVPVADQESPHRSLIAEADDHVPGLLRGPEAGRMVGDTGQVHPSACELDEEQHIHPPQEHRVDGEEIASDDPGGLLTQERPPRRGCATRDGVESMTAEGSSDRGCRDPHPRRRASPLMR
jgi:hypothetical protein